MAVNQTEYDQMYAKVQAGEISAEDWEEYCLKILGQVMTDNVEVFQRLKDR